MDKLKNLLKNLPFCSCFLPTQTNTDEHTEAAKPASPTSSKASASPPTTTTQRPPITLIISHGAFQTQYHYQAFLTAIHSETGTIFNRTLVPQQSSSGPSPPPDSFDRDVQLLHSTVRDELLDGRDVLLVCHSYGGIPGCEALADLPEEALEGKARLGKALGIVFVSAFVADAGQSLVTSKMGGRADWVHTDGPLSTALSPATTLFTSLSPETSAPYVDNLVPQASTSFITPTKHATWKHLPCCYIRCLDDQAMKVAEQDFFVDRLASGSERGKVVVRDLKADHVPFASVPEGLARLVGEVVEDLRRK